MQRTLLKISVSDDGSVFTEMSDPQEAVDGIVAAIWQELEAGNKKAINPLFAVTVHLLAMDPSGAVQREYIERLEELVPAYRSALESLQPDNSSIQQ